MDDIQRMRLDMDRRGIVLQKRLKKISESSAYTLTVRRGQIRINRKYQEADSQFLCCTVTTIPNKHGISVVSLCIEIPLLVFLKSTTQSVWKWWEQK